MAEKVVDGGLAEQITAYSRVRPVYELFAEILTDILKLALRERGMEGIVQARAKGVPNFAEKAIRKRAKYASPVDQFTDLCGARIILDCKDDIPPICGFIRKNFEIDEANSEDVLERLGVSEFGYLSVHFIVSLKPDHFRDLFAASDNTRPDGPRREEYRKMRERLYERRSGDEAAGRGLPPGPVFKAEIQVRTLLQHAWAVLSHDRVYKSEFKVPSLIVRDLNRIAASLEEADDSLARTIRGVEAYRTNFGAYMPPERRRKELDVLDEILRHDPGNRRLAHKIAQMWQSLEEWEKAKAVMRPFVEGWQSSLEGQSLMKAVAERKNAPDGDVLSKLAKQLEKLRSAEMSRILQEYGISLWRAGDQTGPNYLEWAIAIDPFNDDSRVALAETHLSHGADEAMPFFIAAYEANASNPRALAGLLHCKVISERNLEFVELLRPSLEAAIARCGERIRVGVYLPYAYYDIGLFSMFLRRPSQSVAAFGKAAQLTESLPLLNDCVDRIGELRKRVVRDLPELEWIHRFLVLTKAVRARQLACARGSSWQESEAEPYLASVRSLASGKPPRFRPPIVIVAGGCDESVALCLGEYRALINSAFSRFSGTVISGGTTAGVPGLVGDLSANDGRSLNKVGYLPKSIPAWAQAHPGFEICHTDAVGFTPLDSIQAWIDLVAAGIAPEQVRLLVINGGELTDCEIKIALSLGAKVGAIPQTGRAAARIADDEDWFNHPNLLLLPNDPHSVRIFVEGAPQTILDAQTQERIARDAHDEYRRNQSKRHISQDAAMAEWDELPKTLRLSNLDQVKFIEDKLKAVGLTLRKIIGQPPVKAFTFTAAQVEAMAEIEHARWNVERLLGGWRFGERDVDKRTSPYLTAWSELPDGVREWDRQAVLRIPGQLRLNGYEIVASPAANRL